LTCADAGGARAPRYNGVGMRRLERLLGIALFLGAGKRARASDVAQYRS
jgi:hypothetical protein